MFLEALTLLAENTPPPLYHVYVPFGVLGVCGVAWLGFAWASARGNLHLSRTAKAGRLDDNGNTPFALGAREPSRRELEYIQQAIFNITSQSPIKINTHTGYWVIDSFLMAAYTVGTELYVTSTAVNDGDKLQVILAVEMAHVMQRDGQMLMGLRYLVFPFFHFRMTTMGTLNKGEFSARQLAAENSFSVYENVKSLLYVYVASVVFGGLGVLMLSREWAAWFRERDFLADELVCRMNMGENLMNYLEENRILSTAVPFSANWAEYTELRIDRLGKLLSERDSNLELLESHT